MYKKVQNIYVSIDPQGLIENKKYETRIGQCEFNNKKHKSIIKIINKSSQPESFRQIEAIRNMAKRSESLKDSPYVVQCYSQQKTQSKYYVAFKKYKYNLLKLTLDNYEILQMLISMISLLKIFQQKGECHGNLKPTNIFHQKKLNAAICFATTDFFEQKYSNNIAQQYIDPEMILPSVISDIYSLGKIAQELVKNETSYKYVLEAMISPQEKRINLTQLEIEIEGLIEKYEQKNLRIELNRKGITEEVLQKIITKGIEEHYAKLSVLSVDDFELTQFDISLCLRAKAQFFYLAQNNIIQCELIEAYALNCLILALLSETLINYQECLKFTKSHMLKQLVNNDILSLLKYIEKVNLYCELYIQDMILKQQDVSFIQNYLKFYNLSNKLLDQALKPVIEDIINKHLTKEEQGKKEIFRLNLILYINKIQKDKQYDYKQLINYIESLNSIQI